MKDFRHLAFIPVALAAWSFAEPAFAKCVARTAARSDGTMGTILALAPDRGSKDLDDAGYKDAECGKLDKAAYREEVCNPGTLGNSGVLRQLEIQAGISFAQLCSAARAEAGLADTQSKRAQTEFSPTNRRSPVEPRGPSLLHLLAKQNGMGDQKEDN